MFITAVCGNEKLIRKSLLSSVLDFHLIVDNYVTYKHPRCVLGWRSGPAIT